GLIGCSLALRPACSRDRQGGPLRRRLRRLRYLHRRSDCYRLERPSCRAGVSPAEDLHPFTAQSVPFSPFPPCPLLRLPFPLSPLFPSPFRFCPLFRFRGLRRFRCLHRRSDSHRLERPSYQVGVAPTEDQHLSRRTTRSDPKGPEV